MNERIRDIALEASVKYIAAEEWIFTDSELEKFAELIVGQMLAITDAHTEVFQTDRDKALIEHIKKSVKQHFGVEE